ncbi:MAG: hypothetical protein EXS14_07725 [Planctomycetes bacterium]|nr:hypothetical protein [Planctomycetota bacterium]
MRNHIALGFMALALFCTACSTPYSLSPTDALGTWAMSDQDNELFNVLVHPNGKCVSTWWKGAEGAVGEVGTWEIRGDKLRLRWTDGWLDVIGHSKLGLIRQSWDPGRLEINAPLDAAPVHRAAGPLVPFIGVWLSCASKPGKAVHLALRGDGMTARSCGTDTVLGTWSTDGDSATLIFADGVVHRLLRADGQWREDTFAAGAAPGSAAIHSGKPTRY